MLSSWGGYCFGCTRGCRRLIEQFQGMGYHRRTKLLIKLFYAIIYGMPLDESAIMYTCVTRYMRYDQNQQHIGDEY